MDAANLAILNDLKCRLRASARDLASWKLVKAAKWSSELLNGMANQEFIDELDGQGDGGSVDTIGSGSPLQFRTGACADSGSGASSAFSRRNVDPFMGLNEDDYDLYLFVSSLFDCKEFDRCAYFLRATTDPRLKFLKLYCQYLSWDKKYMETTENVLMTGRIDDKTLHKMKSQGKVMGDGGNNDNNHERMMHEKNGGDTILDSGKPKTDTGVIANESGHQTSLSIILNELRNYMKQLLLRLDTGAMPTSNNDGNNNNNNNNNDVFTEEIQLGLALLYYLKGVLLMRQGNKSNAMTAFLESLSYYTFNWSCWTELLNCITKTDESQLLLIHLQEKFMIKQTPVNTQSYNDTNIMLKLFKLSILQEFYNNNNAMTTSNNLATTFATSTASTTTNDNSNGIDEFFEILEYLMILIPNSSFLKSVNAMISYNYMDYNSSGNIFEEIFNSDPYRLEDLDTYSNILYVMQKHSKLSYLAQFVSQVDRFRPETCCIVANYYSARQEHEKSIMYFRRALILDKRSTSAWTLMGHEFVELKNSHAAIECYRRAVDINERDYKAWYGLGQAYEVLDMHLYSLYYFQKACTLRPLDRRMWQAVGDCYSTLADMNHAIECYQRAYQLSSIASQDALLLYKIAEQFEKSTDVDSCKTNMLKCVAIEDHSAEGLVTEETIKARLWLARDEMRMKNYEAAYDHAVNITNGTSQQIEEARNIARNCRQLLK